MWKKRTGGVDGRKASMERGKSVSTLSGAPDWGERMVKRLEEGDGKIYEFTMGTLEPREPGRQGNLAEWGGSGIGLHSNSSH